MLEELLWCMALCQAVTVEEAKLTLTSKVNYSAVSPDELALVYGAQSMGVAFTEHLVNQGKEIIKIERSCGTTEEYELLAKIDFNSSRKRMSLLYRKPDGSVVLYTKGADNVISARLRAGDSFIDDAQKSLDDMAKQGLRTLLLAKKEVCNDAVDMWLVEYEAAKKTGNKEKMEDLESEMEKDLELLGVTGVEDKLQEKVPWALKTLLDANVKTWVCTGDKKDTAINIGYKCNLLQPTMHIMTEWPETRGQNPSTLDRMMRGCLQGRELLLDEELPPSTKVNKIAQMGITERTAAIGCFTLLERWAILEIAKEVGLEANIQEARGIRYSPLELNPAFTLKLIGGDATASSKLESGYGEHPRGSTYAGGVPKAYWHGAERWRDGRDYPQGMEGETTRLGDRRRNVETYSRR